MSVPTDFGVDQGELAEVVVPSDLRSAKNAEDRIMTELARHGYDGNTTFAIKLALEEAITNAVKHGNKNDANRTLIIRFSVSTRRTVLVVRDHGAGFSPHELPDPTADENLELPNGRGIMLMQAYMTKVWYNDVGNEVWMLKDRHAETP